MFLKIGMLHNSDKRHTESLTDCNRNSKKEIKIKMHDQLINIFFLYSVPSEYTQLQHPRTSSLINGLFSIEETFPQLL